MKKVRNSQLCIVLLTGIVLSALMSLAPAFAQPIVKLKAEPDEPKIRLGEFAAIKFSVDVAQDVEFEWSCKNSGECENFKEEQTTLRSSRSYYFLPENLGKRSAEVTITVTVTDKDGKSAQDSLRLTLLASVGKLLELAKEAFDDDHWTTPKGDNAFEFCLEVLSIEPENSEAKKIIYQIEEKYQKKEEEAWAAGDNAKKEEFHERFLFVSRYIQENFPERKIFCDAFFGQFERYKKLRVRELQGEDVNDEILETLVTIADIVTPNGQEEPANDTSAETDAVESDPQYDLQALNEQFKLAHSAFKAAQNEEEKILRTLKMLESLRELKGFYLHKEGGSTASLVKLTNTINRYEEAFLRE